MPPLIRVRSVQLALGLAYAGLAAVAILRNPSPLELLLCVALACGAYATGRSLPEVTLPSTMIWRIAGAGLILVFCGAIADGFGDPKSLGWVAAALAVSAGNRLKAASLGRTGSSQR